MPEDIIASLTHFLQQHPLLALCFIFLIAFSESLIIVGLVVPGAIMMLIFGALIAIDALPFWPSMIAAVAGAIMGDSLSYWLGRRYENKLLTLWPLSRHPDITERANSFFDKHGVKSILLSRFIGLLRPVIPAIAGIARMPLKDFLAANLASAILWAPLYMLPGILFGLSFEMASEFASKFIFIFLFILAAIILSLWALKHLYTFSRPYMDKAVHYLLSWGEKHKIAGEIPAALFDKTHPELKGLGLVAAIIITGTLLLTFIQSTTLIPRNPFAISFDTIDRFIYFSLQALKTPPFNTIMLWLNYLNNSVFIALLCFSVGILLLLKENLLSLWHWLAAIALPLVLTPLLTNNLSFILQQNLANRLSGLSFIVIVSTFGFLSVIVNSGLVYTKQKLVYYFSASFVLLLMLSQLFFATQVFSQVLFGLIVGSIWFSLLGIAYRRHIEKNISSSSRKHLVVIIVLLLIYPSWKTAQHKEIYTRSDSWLVMGTKSWLETGWTLLPRLRQGLKNSRNNFFNLQWVGSESQIRSRLNQQGFEEKTNSPRILSNWFSPGTTIKQLPVLPHIHKGEYEKLRFLRYDEQLDTLTVIRLWPSKFRLRQDSPLRPLWFGSITQMKVKEKAGIKYLVTSSEQLIQPPLGPDRITRRQSHQQPLFLVQ